MKKISLYSITITLVFMLLTVNCGSMPASAEQPMDQAVVAQPESAQLIENISQDEPEIKDPADIVIGYESEPAERKLADLEQACEELGIQCVQGDSMTDLTEQGVDAIISFSNIWSAMGDWPEINAAVSQGFPLYLLDGETGEAGAYNLAYSSDWVRTSMQWMFDQMGNTGEMVYVNIGHNDFYEDLIQNELESHPNIQATSIPTTYEDQSAMETENIAAMVAENPDLGAVWSSEAQGNIFWGINDMWEGKMPAIICQNRQEELQYWKDRIADRPEFQCIAAIQPGGNAYEAVYVAYYRLIGMELNPDALGGEFGNTLLYDDLVITNDNLDEWLAKTDELRESDWGALELPPMTPEEIQAKWFLE